MTETLSATAARNFIGGGVERERRPARRTRSATRGARPRSPACSPPRRRTTPGAAVAPRAQRSRPGRRSRLRPRAAFFFKAADAIEARVEQIAQDMTAEMGKPLREAADGGRARSGDPSLFGRRGVPAGRRGLRAVGRQPDPLHAPPAARCRRPDHTVELPHRDPCLEARPGAHLRQHRRAQARLRGAAHGPAHRGVLRGGRAAGRAS